MKVLFAVSNDNITTSVVSKYQQKFKEIITSKNVYYFNAIIKELQRDKTYDAVVIGEDLEPFSNNNYETVDKFIFEKLDNISDEASKPNGDLIPIILICSDRRTKSDELLKKIFGISIYNAILGNDRSIDTVCNLINKPRNKKEAKNYYKIDSADELGGYEPEVQEAVSEQQIQNIINYYKKIGSNEKKCAEAFDSIANQYNDTQLRIIVKFLPMSVKAVLETASPRYQQLMTNGTVLSNGKYTQYQQKNDAIKPQNLELLTRDLEKPKLTEPVIIPSAMNISQPEKINTTKMENETNQYGENINRQVSNPYSSNRNETETNHNQLNSMGQALNSYLSNMNGQESNQYSSNREEQVPNPYSSNMNNQVQNPYSSNMNNQVPNTYSSNMNNQVPNSYSPNMNNQVPNSYSPNMNNQVSNPYSSNMNNQVSNPYSSNMNNQVPNQYSSNLNGQTSNQYQSNVNQQHDEENIDSLESKLKEYEDLNKNDDELKNEIQINNLETESNLEEQPRRRGRPRKIKDIDEENNQTNNSETKRRRGRPRKIEENEEKTEEVQQINNPLLDFDEINKPINNESRLSGFEEPIAPIAPANNESMLPGFEEQIVPIAPVHNESMLPGFEEPTAPIVPANNEQNLSELDKLIVPIEKNENASTYGMTQDYSQNHNINQANNIDQNYNMNQANNIDQNYDTNQENKSNQNYNINQQNDYNQSYNNSEYQQYNSGYSQYDNQSYQQANNYQQPNNNELVNNQNVDNTISNNLVAGLGKIVSFVGTTKNGTSFIVNNLAQLLSQNNVKVAIVDLTKNKNAYYMFTNNDTELVREATDSLNNLSKGIAQGLNVNKNLTVYTSVPDELEDRQDNINVMLSTLSNNYDIVLLDCDFKTDANYFTNVSEIYLVQTMDALTIQPLTKFLSALKTRNLLDETKLRVIINKYIKLKKIDDKMIIAGMSRYNEPSMTLQRDLFNRNTIKYIDIPFEEQTYAKYLEEIALCQISLAGYSQNFLGALEQLKNMVYPLISGGNKNINNYATPKKHSFFGGKKEKYTQNINQIDNSQSTTKTTQFSGDMNQTLNKMRSNY